MRAALPIGPLLLTVFTSILEVFLLCLAGYILAAKGILDKKTQKQLNRLNVSLFTPSLLFSKVAFFLSPAKLRELWIIPIFFVIVTLVSMSVAFLLGWIFRVKKSQRSFAMAAAMFMNSNSLPIALMQSLVVTVGGLHWTDDDNKNAMLGRALTYLVLYSTLGMVLRWSFGVKLLAQADDDVGPIRLPDDDDETDSSDSEILAGTPEEIPQPITGHPNIVIDDVDRHATQQRRPNVPQRRSTRFYNSFPNSPNQSYVTLPGIQSEAPSTNASNSDDGEYDSENESSARNMSQLSLPQHHHYHPSSPSSGSRRSAGVNSSATSSPFRSFMRRTRKRVKRFWVAFNDFMTVPLWAALASIIVACAQPLQHALEMHMQPVKGALTSAGNCSIPVTLIVLGAYFYPESKEGSTQTTNGTSPSLLDSIRDIFKKDHHHRQGRVERTRKQNNNRPGETKTVAIAVMSRMIVTPVLLLPLMAVAKYSDMHALVDDPIFVLANVLLVTSPPALTLAQITQAASGDAFERLISRTIFWAYCIVTPPATILYVVIALLMTKL
ncbi:hypothetical protein K435DRAFT_669909 [Dendrothele bispora CBS 962.96]|uniref:Auxin efflux carrier n=1 Tax=Dendrothele bispora (strain CBS 962.96) TaxID=1314807 RepID=A0A4S8LVZ3_DENBC|nr:hypothetical protein K435DRAFT_669909 [Dendrothele bispora CBS 962.96]